MDVIGWLDEQALGVLMHDTNKDEAEIFIDTIKKQMYTFLTRPIYHIYLYPDNFFNDFFNSEEKVIAGKNGKSKN